MLCIKTYVRKALKFIHPIPTDILPFMRYIHTYISYLCVISPTDILPFMNSISTDILPFTRSIRTDILRFMRYSAH